MKKPLIWYLDMWIMAIFDFIDSGLRVITFGLLNTRLSWKVCKWAVKRDRIRDKNNCVLKEGE